MDLIIHTRLFLTNGKEITITVEDTIVKQLNVIKALYDKLPEFDSSRKYESNMIRTVVSDIEIEHEGYTSCIESISAVTSHRVKNKNQLTAMNMLSILKEKDLETQEITKEFIINLWKKLTTGCNNHLSYERGYRKHGVSVMRKHFGVPLQVLYNAPSVKMIDTMMNSLIDYMNSDLAVTGLGAFGSAIIKAIVVSIYFVYIHPFSDGNGRMSRILTSKVLIDAGLPKFRYISVNAAIASQKGDYNSEILEFERKNTGDLTRYTQFMLGLFISTFIRITEPSIIKRCYTELNPREKIMIRVIKAQKLRITAKEYKRLWNKIANDSDRKSIIVEEAREDLDRMFRLGLVEYYSSSIKDGIRFYCRL